MIVQYEILPGITIKLDHDQVERVAAKRWNNNSHRGATESVFLRECVNRGMSLAKFISGINDGRQVVKRNGDALDYTKDNLIAATRAEVSDCKPAAPIVRHITDASYIERLLMAVAPEYVAMANKVIAEDGATPQEAAYQTIQAIPSARWAELLVTGQYRVVHGAGASL